MPNETTVVKGNNMERTVLFLCCCWLWLTRKRRSIRYHQIAHSLHSASAYLLRDYANRASTQDRGCLLPDQIEALNILERKSTQAFHTACRLSSFGECYRLIAEEFAPPPALPAPRAEYRKAA